MQTTLPHLSTGIHGSVYAYRKPATAVEGQKEERESVDLSAHGPSGWAVVKVVRAGPSGKTRELKPHNVLREVLVLQKAKHRNIVRVLDYAWSESVWEHQLALPLLAITFRVLLDSSLLDAVASRAEQEDLPDLSRLSVASSHPPSVLETLFRSVALQLLIALGHLHALGIAHRDVKPENIMLDWDGTVVLIDLGTAWDEEGEDWGTEWKEDREDMCCEVGTGPYRAPELLFGPITYDAAAIDLWAAGCVLAEFFTASVHHAALDIDPLDQDSDAMAGDGQWDAIPDEGRQSLFDSTYGDLGLAGSIFGVRGSPTSTSWPAFQFLPDSNKVAFAARPPRLLGYVLPGLEALLDPVPARDLLDALLALDPSRRIPAASALLLDVFVAAPVLVPSGLIRRAEYREIGGKVQLLERVGGRSIPDLLRGLLDPARRRWE